MAGPPISPAAAPAGVNGSSGRGGAGSLAKAYLELMERSGSGATATTKPTGRKIEFQFNPTDLEISKSARWHEKATKVGNAPPPEYEGPQAAELTVKMFLDTSGQRSGDVSKDVDRLFTMVVPTASSTRRGSPLPPFVIFGWGRKIHLRAYVTSVSASYTLFRGDGTPIRATCTVRLKELPRDFLKQNPTSGGIQTHDSVELVDGDSLASVAYRAYGNPHLWRTIAEANGIDDPMRVAPGTRLLVPTVIDADPQP